MALRELLALFQIKVEGTEKVWKANESFTEAIARVKQLDNQLKNLGGNSGKSTALFSALEGLGQAFLGGTITAGIGQFVEGQVDIATSLDQTSRILGVTTNELQQFHLAAQLSNTSIEAVDSALRFLNRTIGAEGGHGIGAKGAQELETLGIKLKEVGGKSRPVIDVFADLADKLKATGDQGKATEIAMQVMGRGGARSLPLLMQGGEELRRPGGRCVQRVRCFPA